MRILRRSFSNLLSLFYPDLCAACGKSLGKGEEVICIFCQYNLPKTNFHLERNNSMEKHFWGRVQIERAAAYLIFQKGNRTQHLVHQLKYRGRKEIGVAVGKIYGAELNQSLDFKNVEVIIPVPLHKKKELKRGFNQVDLFCLGLSQSMNKPWLKNVLQRKKVTETQTKKDRFDRWINVADIFVIAQPKLLEGKHVLLTDDVVTTGSTLEACAQAILEVPGTKVSVATIACVVKR